MSRSHDMEDLLPDLGLADVLQQRPIGIGTTRHAIRIALAVTVSFVVARAVSQSAFALFAPITTLLVVQASPWTTLGVSVQRILGTGIGVLVASVYVNLLGLTWWSFLIGVLAALLIARRLPWSLGGQLQIPVAVVFVLALGPGSIQQDLWRVIDVIIGGLIGIIAVFAFPPKPRPDAFEATMSTYRDAIVEILRSVGLESGSHEVRLGDDAAHDFVAPSRRLRERADTARLALLRLVEGSHLNMRAGGLGDELEGYAIRLRRLSGIGVQVRGVVGAANRLYDRPGVDPILTDQELRTLIDDELALVEAVLGGPGEPVRGVDRELAQSRDTALSERLRLTADALAGRREKVGDVLESVSMLGRLDHIRAQLAVFPGWED